MSTLDASGRHVACAIGATHADKTGFGVAA
jgi:hypothetical protein